MGDIMDMADYANDADRQSRRDRWKDAISKTKSKWKKEKVTQPQEDFKLSDDVNDFLAAGRKPVVTATVRPIHDESHNTRLSPRPSTSDSRTSPQPSPRGVPVPRLDVSQTRWPNSRPVEGDPRSRSDVNLTPNYNRQPYERSYSFNSALKKNMKPRGLSVTFDNSAPVIIGEGGDSAEIPTMEISRAKRQRARSLSPYVDRPTSMHSNGSNNQSPRRKPVPSPTRTTNAFERDQSPRRKPVPSPTGMTTNSDREDSMFQPRPMRRIQTGFSEQQVRTPYVSKDFTRQLEKALNLDEYDSPVSPYVNSQNAAMKLPSPADQPRHIQLGQPINLAKEPIGIPGSLRTGPPIAQSSHVQHDDYTAHKTSPQAVYQPNMQQHNQHNFRTSPQDVHHPDFQQMAHTPTRTSPHAVHHPYHPDLQHSQETSHKPPPPKVPNFYANISKQNIEDSPVDAPLPAMHHAQQQIQQTQRPRSPRSMLDKFRKNSAESPNGTPRMPVQNHDASPGGWI